MAFQENEVSALEAKDRAPNSNRHAFLSTPLGREPPAPAQEVTDGPVGPCLALHHFETTGKTSHTGQGDGF